MRNLRNIKDFTREERKEAFKALGLPAFREQQVFAWICRGAKGWDACTDLSKDLRSRLAGEFSWENAAVEAMQTSSDGTRKFLAAFPDGQRAEEVFMAYEYGNSLCISTQVGCRMGCRFCASTIGGRVRDLKAWEMLEEYVLAVRESGQAVNHVVLMGMGEPFDNYEEVAAFLRLIHDPKGIGLSYRNITVSTCGLVPGIRRFTEEFPQVNLAISLHAASQAEREKLMPVAKAYPLDELLAACRDHAEKTGRRVTFEFALIAGQNDTPETAARLANLLRGMLCHVNLIPLNPVEETGLAGSSRQAAAAFRETLEKQGIPATVRRQLGADIDAACGQLRKKYT